MTAADDDDIESFREQHDRSRKEQRSIVGSEAPAKLSVHGLNHGIALYNRRANGGAFGDFQMITPPLTIREGELGELLLLLERSLSDLQAEIERDGFARF